MRKKSIFKSEAGYGRGDIYNKNGSMLWRNLMAYVQANAGQHLQDPLHFDPYPEEKDDQGSPVVSTVSRHP
jgi:hypothetical protein